VAHRSEFMRSIEHAVRRTPPRVAVEGDLQRRCDTTFDLELLEVLDALTRCLDLGI
jgi:hypothetical protein